MDLYFLEYRDPLFGIIIFFILLFVIAFFSYWYNKFKKKEHHKHLDNFLKQFQTSKVDKNIEPNLAEFSEKSWLLLADAFVRNGDYARATEIYSQLIKSSNDSKEIMFLLGKTLFMAGFIERAKKTFLEILKDTPRTPQALNYLMLIYEQLRDYKSALEILEPLRLLKSDISAQEAYLNTHILLSEPKLDREQKIQKLLELHKKTHKMNHDIFEYLFRVSPEIAWQNIDISRVANIVDILWSLELKDLNFDIIMKSSYLVELYSAKKYIDKAKSSAVFEFDVLINSNESSSATLGFEFVCGECGYKQPFSFARCPSCHALESMSIELLIVKDYSRNFSEESNSFL